jgi:Macrocin-O-methyltransferase (TylF)
MTTSRPSLAATPVTVKCPTRIITYGWGERYVDVLLAFTLPALLAAGNLPYVASEVPCELVILTQRRFFSKFNRHPVIARIKKLCPVRLMRLDDLVVSKDKYGMTLTYALHRAFSDLGPAMTEHWQIFLNADFILADRSLRTVISHLARGQRIVASPSYCTVAEEVMPELRKHFDPATSTLSISHRELARLILQHRHTVIRGKTVNQTAFHMRYADQFYWSVDGGILLGYQMPVSIVGLWPERYVTEPNAYWDFGLIWEYCPRAEICVIGDSDEFTMLELRDKIVAEDQIVLGPPEKKEMAERMVTWVTPYQQHFLKFPLTLHEVDLPPSIDDARTKLRSFVDEVMLHTPPLPSHIKHSQWEYHWTGFQDARRLSNRIRLWCKIRLQHAETAAISLTHLIPRTFEKTFGRLRVALQKAFSATSLAKSVVKTTSLANFVVKATPLAKVKTTSLANFVVKATPPAKFVAKGKTFALRFKRKASAICMTFARIVGDRIVRPAFRRLGLEIVKSTTIFAIRKTADEAILKAREDSLKAEQAILKAQQETLKAERVIRGAKDHLKRRRETIARLTEKVTDLGHIATEYQFKLERSYNYQTLMAQDQLRAGMSNLEPEFLALYEQCREYTMTSWERLYALYKSVRYIVENSIAGDLVECGVWRGGSMKLVAHVLYSLGDTNRTLFLYDTFEGMTEPDPALDKDFSGNPATNDWNEVQRRGVKWAYAPVQEVEEVLAKSGYPLEKIKFVKGPVEETIPATIPASIALLRLDTDWHSSTKHEMEHLYPRVSPQGIVVLDDYGHYQGARRAVDDYLSKLDKKPLLQRVDYSCFLLVKQII